jgi:hypothetical protein
MLIVYFYKKNFKKYYTKYLKILLKTILFKIINVKFYVFIIGFLHLPFVMN